MPQSAKKKSCFIINGWVKSIFNHFCWCCGSCDGDEQLLTEKRVSILFHIQNKHSLAGNMLFHKCCHPNIPQNRKKAWLNPSEAFVALQNFILDKNLLGDLKHLTNISHTGSLEVCHSSYNKWLTKSTHFSYQGMIASSQLAAIDFNLCSELSQAETKSGGETFQCYIFKSN